MDSESVTSVVACGAAISNRWVGLVQHKIEASLAVLARNHQSIESNVDY